MGEALRVGDALRAEEDLRVGEEIVGDDADLVGAEDLLDLQ